MRRASPAVLSRRGACRALLVAGLAAWALACAARAPEPAPPAPPPEPQRLMPAELAPGAGQPAVVLLVTVAGLTPEAYLGADPAMPQLASLAERGVAAERIATVAPPAAYPTHATLVTGVPPREHGVVADRLRGERGVRTARYAHVSHLRAETLWQAVAAAGAPVAAFDWPTTTGATLAALLPDVAPQRRGERWSGLVAKEATPWIAALVETAGEAVEQPGPARDGALVDAACTALRSGEPPRLLLLRLRQTEPVLLEHGPWSAAARAAFARADLELARLAACVAEAGHADQAALVVAGDRAFVPVTTAVRPNRVLREVGLLGSAGPGRGLAWRALARSNGGSAFVYARDAEAALAARDALEQSAAASGAFRIVGAEEMIAREADPEAWFGLDALPGYVLLGDSQGPVLSASPVRAAGGGLRDPGPGLVAAGRGLRGGLHAPRLDLQDVAPTLARLLQVSLEDARGRARVGWLAPGVGEARR